jgi:hypothetical protein
VNKVFQNNIVSLVKIQIYSNLDFLRKYKKNQEKNYKKTRTNSEQIGEEIFENNIVALFKIQIYSNLNFLRK